MGGGGIKNKQFRFKNRYLFVHILKSSSRGLHFTSRRGGGGV